MKTMATQKTPIFGEGKGYGSSGTLVRNPQVDVQ